jgi:hypothetical protein
MEIAYRAVCENDLPQLQRLWEENTDWGTLTPQMWRRYVTEAPLGGASIVVAVDRDTEQIVGQFGFTPSLVRIDNRTVPAFRPAAPIVGKSMKSVQLNPLNHPAVAMYRHGMQILRKRHGGLIYMMPDRRWVPFLRLIPGLVIGTYPMWSARLPFPDPLPMPRGFSASRLHEWTDAVDLLWERASRLHGCSVVRNAAALKWKVGNGDYDVQIVQSGGELSGLVAPAVMADSNG